MTKKDILIFGRGITQSLDGTTLTAEAEYSINFTEHENKFSLSLHCNGSSSYLFVNGVKIYLFKVKDPELFSYPLCLGKISKKISVENMKETGLNGYVYDFSVDYFNTFVNKIIDIHIYLLQKNSKIMLGIIKK